MYRRTRIKMCGTTNGDDATKAVQLGVDALGFIFAKKSPRYLNPEKAPEIIELVPPFIFKVGVFVNEDRQNIEEIIHYLGLNGVQLHGDENVEFCESLQYRVPTCAVLKAMRVGEHTSAADFSRYSDVVKGFVLDTYVKDQEGGTGLSFDWNIIERLQLKKPYVLAGGLTPDNIHVALKRATPFAVDVNSGVEHAPGCKDHLRLERFIKRVAEADAQ